MSSSYLDQKYINLVATKLEKFKWKSGSLANFRCVICGDSQKDQNKTRGYFYEKAGSYIMHCHNCSITLSLGNFLKKVDPALHREYLLENYKDAGRGKAIQPPNKMLMEKPIFTTKITLPTCENPIARSATKYLTDRMIPPNFIKQLYYTTYFKNFVDDMIPGNDKENLPNDDRIIIPFRDEKGDLVGFTGRSLDPDAKTRYIIIKINQFAPTMYGLDKFDKTKPGFVVEGPFDSMFLPNCLAACGSNIKDVSVYVDPTKTTFILDNEPRNYEIMKQYNALVARKLNIFVWPKYISFKDINEWVMAETPVSKILDIISSNVFSGVEAEFRLNLWKKC